MTSSPMLCGLSNLGWTVVILSGRGLLPKILSVSGALHVANDTDVPILVSSGEHICHARQITSVSGAVDPDVCSRRTRLCSESNTSYYTEVSIDPEACLTMMMSGWFS
ncbi:hypothetical protein NP493_252g03017 [Ridgeia piscesae]|uniref:Uncharacterized protein n=1 Tax=Ridgeia piscesae TaxID=27915 RepID=A0AAD9UCV5_RIDPI|nr:hypothetical protein NP493_252g03017 [Ridgeia piscesae]